MNLRKVFKLKDHEKLVYILLDGSNSKTNDRIELDLDENCKYCYADAYEDSNPFEILV
jgi:hypothetical protein